MKRNFWITIFVFSLLALATTFCPPAMAQRSSSHHEDVTGALTGTNPVAPETTGIGQVVQPIIPSPLSETQERREQGLSVPYPMGGPPAPPPAEQPSERVKGGYYEQGVKQSGQYYEQGAREKGGYQPLGVPEAKPSETETKPYQTTPENKPGEYKPR